jgi:hypothetical protein
MANCGRWRMGQAEQIAPVRRREWWRGAGRAARGTEATDTLAILAKPADRPGVLEISGVFGRILAVMGGLGEVSGGRRVRLRGERRGGVGWKGLRSVAKRALAV